jgi:uncharacterized protein DUF4157
MTHAGLTTEAAAPQPAPAQHREPAQPPQLVRRCACGGIADAHGECASCRAKRLARQASPDSYRPVPDLTGIPNGLSIGPVNDPAEREANQTADRITTGGVKSIRRAPLTAAGPGLQAAPPLVGHVLSQAGRPLDGATRSYFEPRLGTGLGDVRVHDDVTAARSARAIDARAYALGPHIVFGEGELAPDRSAGRRLLAHELVHVLQHRAPGSAPVVRPQRHHTAARSHTPAPRYCPKGHGKMGSAPCAPSDACEGTCSRAVEPYTINPCCGNESCATSGAAGSFFIRHLDVDLRTQMVTAEWGDAHRTTHVSMFLSSPNPSPPPHGTPPGSHRIGLKCGRCHTNADGHGMAWLAAFHNGIEYGFHNSQRVGSGVHSLGCVRVPGCACAREVHDNTASGTTSVCVHSAGNCNRSLPRAGARDSGKASVCAGGHLQLALPPAAPTHTTPAHPPPAHPPHGSRHNTPVAEEEAAPWPGAVAPPPGDMLDSTA